MARDLSQGRRRKKKNLRGPENRRIERKPSTALLPLSPLLVDERDTIPERAPPHLPKSRSHISSLPSSQKRRHRAVCVPGVLASAPVPVPVTAAPAPAPAPAPALCAPETRTLCLAPWPRFVSPRTELCRARHPSSPFPQSDPAETTLTIRSQETSRRSRCETASPPRSRLTHSKGATAALASRCVAFPLLPVGNLGPSPPPPGCLYIRRTVYAPRYLAARVLPLLHGSRISSLAGRSKQQQAAASSRSRPFCRRVACRFSNYLSSFFSSLSPWTSPT